jgi:hypothetical protein
MGLDRIEESDDTHARTTMERPSGREGMDTPTHSNALVGAPAERERHVHPIPMRALLIGGVTVTLLSFLCPYLGAVSETWDPGGSALPVTAVVALFALVALNSLLIRVRPKWELTRVELLVVYGMVILVVQFPYKGLMPFITGATAWPVYGATPSNDWKHRICREHLHAGSTPQRERGACRRRALASDDTGARRGRQLPNALRPAPRAVDRDTRDHRRRGGLRIQHER